ncbi:cell number regulator 13 [Artemisia annua]|uniref:Cell number regulator 13 n=1 Tax=Artemisia annua TaxID=35608 RepID=A0A2U1LFJ8_ARTAN|nr:cell number regulator 13 [Artemisia annua]
MKNGAYHEKKGYISERYGRRVKRAGTPAYYYPEQLKYAEKKVKDVGLQERLEYIEMDQREYTFDDEDRKVIKKDKEKLHVELQQSQSTYDVGQCEVIQHLIEPQYSNFSSNSDVEDEKPHSTSRSTSTAMVVYDKDMSSTRESYGHGEWQSDLLGSC